MTNRSLTTTVFWILILAASVIFLRLFIQSIQRWNQAAVVYRELATAQARLTMTYGALLKELTATVSPKDIEKYRLEHLALIQTHEIPARVVPKTTPTPAPQEKPFYSEFKPPYPPWFYWWLLFFGPTQ